MLTEEVLLTSYNPCCKEGWPAGKHNFLSCPDTIRNDSRQEEKNIMSLGVSTALKGIRGFWVKINYITPIQWLC